MKKLIILPFLVFGQFITNAQKPAQKGQQIITLKLMPAGPVHLPKVKGNGNGNNGNGNGNGKDKNQLPEKVELSQDKNFLTSMQVVESIVEDKNTAVKSRSVIYTVTSL